MSRKEEILPVGERARAKTTDEAKRRDQEDGKLVSRWGNRVLHKLLLTVCITRSRLKLVRPVKLVANDVANDFP